MLNVNLCCACFAHSHHTIRSAAETDKADAKEATAKQDAANTANATKLDHIAKIGFSDGTLNGARNAVVAAAASAANDDDGMDSRHPMPSPCPLQTPASITMGMGVGVGMPQHCCDRCFSVTFLILTTFPDLTPRNLNLRAHVLVRLSLCHRSDQQQTDQRGEGRKREEDEEEEETHVAHCWRRRGSRG